MIPSYNFSRSDRLSLTKKKFSALKPVVKSFKTLFMVQKYSAMLLETCFLYLRQFVFKSIVNNGKLMEERSSSCMKLDQ